MEQYNDKHIFEFKCNDCEKTFNSVLHLEGHECPNCKSTDITLIKLISFILLAIATFTFLAAFKIIDIF